MYNSNDKKLKKCEGINFDFILAISNDNGKLSINKIKINRHEALIDCLIQMAEDTHSNAFDMYQYTKHILKRHDYLFPFCLGYNYYDSYIEDVCFPEFDVHAYLTEISNAQRHIENMVNKGYHDYAKKLANDLTKNIRQGKEIFLEKVLAYIYSYDYNEALKLNYIEDKYHIFSSEIHGRFTYETNITEHFKIFTKTNFCFGRSSYFHIIVKYKDIELLPYSEWINYYYAGYNSIMRYTRSYLCDRNSWTYAMEFIVRYVNEAIHDVDYFVRNEVMSEVNSLVDGLEKIFKLNESVFRNILDIKHIDDDDVRYIGISSARHANDGERAFYKIKPSECAMIFRMEKISGALHFLQSLHKLSDIYTDVQVAINRIIELNKAIYPEIIKAIPPIKQEIRDLQYKLKSIERIYDNKHKRYVYLDNILNLIINKESDSTQKENIETEFKKQHPDYSMLEQQVQKLNKQIFEYKDLIYEREQTVQRLKSFKELIDNNTRN